ncbi:MAG: 2-phospho-L-lactate transferase [Chloroflexota bacterium]
MVEVSPRVVALAGGVGAARLLEGLVQMMDPERLTVIANTGDDCEFHGLHVSPDVDIVLYTLGGIIEPSQGWGVRGDTYAAGEMLARYGRETWFQLGDRDLATHIHRTAMLRRGATLSEVTDQIRRSLGVACRVIPMTDSPVQTRVKTPAGWLPFQEYFVRRRTTDDVLDIDLEGAADAIPAPGVLEAIAEADAIIISPSNPLVSIGTILSIPGVRGALRDRRERAAAISPIVGGATIKGPADRMLRAFGFEVSAAGVAACYRDVIGALVIDEVDADLVPSVEAHGVRAVVTNTMMRDLGVKRALARVALDAALGR